MRSLSISGANRSSNAPSNALKQIGWDVYFRHIERVFSTRRSTHWASISTRRASSKPSETPQILGARHPYGCDGVAGQLVTHRQLELPVPARRRLTSGRTRD